MPIGPTVGLTEVAEGPLWGADGPFGMRYPGSDFCSKTRPRTPKMTAFRAMAGRLKLGGELSLPLGVWTPLALPL